MNKQEKIDRFIKLRSEGLTFEKIASVLDITERTLYYWNKKHYRQIEEMVLLHQQELMKELLVSRNDRMRFFADEFTKVRSEVLNSTPRLHYHNLLKLVLMLNKELEKFDMIPNHFSQDDFKRIQENVETECDSPAENL